MFSKANAYERFMGRWSRLLAPDMVRFAEIRDGDAVLDVGSGTGALALAIRAQNASGRVVGVDAAQDYVSLAAQGCDDPGVRFELGDAQDLRHSTGAFDKTVSSLVLNFVPDPGRALKEMSRVTKRGGLVAAAVWDYGEGMQMLRVFWDEVNSLAPGATLLDEARMPLCKQGELGDAWRREGLGNVVEAPLTVSLRFMSFDDYWAPFLLGQGPAGAYVASLSSELRLELEQRLRGRLLGTEADRPIELAARAWAVKGIVA
jgi:SAM-dependent methyltransferase